MESAETLFAESYSSSSCLNTLLIWQVVVLTGPTAVGKTKVSLSLAEKLDGEVISADSIQVYRGLDVGSDKVCCCFRHGLQQQ